MHHVVCDGWSLGVLTRELGSLYETYSQGFASTLAELPIQYADYALWQRNWMQGKVLEEQLAYWRDCLANLPVALELPTDRPRPAMPTYRGARCDLWIPRECVDSLYELARREKVTLYMVLLAGLQVVLSRWSGQQDVAVGSPVAGRTHSKTEELIGFFINMLVMRTNLSGNPNFRELLGQVREVALGAYAHQDIPFERLVAELRIPRDPARQPLFQVSLALQNAERLTLDWRALDVTLLHAANKSCKFDLSFDLFESEGALIGGIEFAEDLFDAQTIERMAVGYKTLLQAVASDAEQLIANLPLMGPAELDQVLEEWNDTDATYPRDRCVHELFEERVKHAPEAVAVIHGAQSLTYLELNVKANQLAHLLIKRGVGPGEPVLVLIPRSAELITAQLAVMKCGAMYIPLECDAPAERLVAIAIDCKARRALTSGIQRDGLEYLDWIECHDTSELLAQPRENPAVAADGASAAYVMYTSGSTGRPKGVVVPHRAISRLVINSGYIVWESTDCVVHCSNPAFDASTFEVWAPLLHGAKILIVPQFEELDTGRFAILLQRHNATVLWLSVGLFKQCATKLGAVLATLRYLLVGGDAVDPNAVRLLLQEQAPQHLLNGYGPTECTTFATTHDIESVGPDETIISIGRPIGNTKVYVLDAYLQPVPISVIGELYIAGEGLAHGYLHRTGLTAESFLADPFSRSPGRRMYRTGDVGRWRTDGRLEVLGRRDTQVKIRGYRVELGEIEVRLAQHPKVQEAVVVAQEEKIGEKRLVGYIVPRSATDVPGPQELRSHLKGSLPSYMVPGVFMTLDAIPLTTNGKVNREALPAADSAALGVKQYEKPEGDTEEALASIWQELLHIAQVGREDDFFELGGHSLLAMQLVSRLRERLNIELPVRVIFDEPILKSLGDWLDHASNESSRREIDPPARPDSSAPAPLSFSQERLWLLSQLNALGSAYHIPQVLKIDGRLNVAALERSFKEIVRRHEILRTRFKMIGGAPRQVVESPLLWQWAMQNVTDASDKDLKGVLRQEVLAPFELEGGSLFRVVLLQRSALEHVLVIATHHIICDGWSLGVLARELRALYEAYSQGLEADLPELPMQYADYAIWQRDSVHRDTLDSQLAYWRQRLAELPAALNLPTDRPRPAMPSFRGAHHSFQVDRDGLDGIRRLARRESATLYMVLLAALQVVLSRWSGQKDVAVGSPIAGRNSRKSEDLIGFFINMLVLRTNLSDNPTFDIYLRQVRDVTLGAFANQEVPFERLVAELQPHRDLSRQALFQVSFALQNMQPMAIVLPGLAVTSLGTAPESAKFDLLFEFFESDNGLVGGIEYATDLFDGATIASMAETYKAVLEGIAENSNRPIETLPLLKASRCDELLRKWNDTGELCLPGCCVHELFEAQAARAPTALAVVGQGQQLTYQELNDQSNQLAHYLREQGAGPEKVVGLCMERSPSWVVAALAVLKSGSAYLALDPLYPTARLSFMLEDCAAPLLLLDSDHIPRFPNFAGARVAYDTQQKSLSHYPMANLGRIAEEDGLAYVIYTSGSTGRPKAVGAVHRALVNRVMNQEQITPLSTEEVFCQKTAIGFVDSVAETWVPLLRGHRLVVIPQAVSQDARLLPKQLGEASVTRLLTVPSLARAWVADGQSLQHLKGLRSWTLSGEALDAESLEQLQVALPHCQFVNLYGSSEVAADTTVYRCEPGLQSSSVPIGRPLCNTVAYVLDESLNPVPQGVVGELYIGGAGLARGYLSKPAQTAERFVANPFGGPGSRLYRTGDLARYRHDGQLEYRGRCDSQVKVRGYRIELAEIEESLLRHPGVVSAVVVTQDASTDLRDQKLAAYVVAEAGIDLREYLQETLPEYMIPSAFVFLDHLPLLPSGKVDRRSLPAQEPTRLEQKESNPRTPTEEVLLQIWADVLNKECVGVEDNFFELGGHSLVAAQVTGRVRESLFVELPLRAMFDGSVTVRQVASKIDQLRRASHGLRLPDLVAREPVLEGVPLSFAQERLWFLEQFENLGATHNDAIPLYIDGELDLGALKASLQELVRRHESLRTHIVTTEDGRGIQVIEPAGPFELQLLDLSDLAAEDRQAQQQRFVMVEADKALKLENSLFRAVLLRLSIQEHVLVVTFHHIISDAWSFLAVFQPELNTLYSAYSKGETSPLPEPTIQYADYVVWQRRWLKEEVLQDQLNYWKAKLISLPVAIDLPTDRPRPALPSFRGARHYFFLTRERTQGLQRLARRENVTLYMALLAFLQTLLSRWSGQQDIVIGSPIAGRIHRKTEGLIGLFLNNLVMRTDLSGNPTFLEILQRVKRVALEAYANQDVPFERLVAEIQPQRDLSRMPLFQVMLVLQNQPTDKSPPQGLTLRSAPIPHVHAKYDLTLSVLEISGGLACTLEYATDLFDLATIESFAESFKALVDGALAEPGQAMSQLPLLRPEQREELLQTMGVSAAQTLDDRTVHEVFEAQVRSTPSGIALEYEDEEVTYAKLNSKANQLARELIGRGVGPDLLVGICLERSLEMFVAVLGVLKAGGAYLPLDPDAPSDRLRSMIEDARPKILISNSRLAERLAFTQTHIVRMDEDWPVIARFQDGNIPSQALGLVVDHLAYAIYTSGSTGQAKGVLLSHRGVCSLASWQQRAFAVGQGSRVLQFSSFTFDACTWEWVMALCSGARLCVAPSVDLALGEPLTDTLKRRGITHVTLPPIAANTLSLSEGLDKLRTLIVAGDACPQTLAQRWAGSRQFINAYGPTEATVCASVHRCETGDAYGPPIGRPIANARMYVLDSHQQLVPVGVRGEIYIGGIGVGRGYLGKPRLTAERFLADPFSPERGTRMYRTGDLGRCRVDGTIEHLGRNDFQVKIRGYRIEPAEIEAQLLLHSKVRQATVVTRVDGSGEKDLVAYVVPWEDQVRPSVRELRNLLKGVLPLYMIPSAFVIVERLPLTENGKLNRAALPAPDQSAYVTRPYQAPQGDLEDAFAQIWRDVLQVERVGRHDNFFELGGNSMLLMRVLSRIKAVVDRPISIVDLFKYPSLGELAGFCTTGAVNSQDDDGLQERVKLRRQKMTRLRRVLGND
jgi:amino acid adenylation domain-containing protein